MPGRLIRTALIAALALLLTAPAGAAAATRYVDGAIGEDASNDCLDQTEPCKSIGRAVVVALGGDEVQIAAGTYDETIATEKALTFKGAGSGLSDEGPITRVRGLNGSGAPGLPAFELPKGGSLESLIASGGAGGVSSELPIPDTPFSGGPGVLFEPAGPGTSTLSLVDVKTEGGQPGEASFAFAPQAPGLRVAGAAYLLVEDSRLEAGPALIGTLSTPAVVVSGPDADADFYGSQLVGVTAFVGGDALRVESGAGVRLVGSEASAPGLTSTAAVVSGGTLTASGSTLFGNRGVWVSPVTAPEATAILRNSLAVGTGLAGGEVVAGGAATEASLLARGSTIVGRGQAGASAGVSVIGEPGTGALVAKLDNSIARHEPPAPATPVDLLADGRSIQANHSSFNSVQEPNGGSAPSPGAGTNVAGDPQFVNASALDFHLKPGSPLIDRGDPALIDPIEKDFEGNPRSLDGNGDCVAAPDIGAYELTGHEAACPDTGGSGGGAESPGPAEKKETKGGPTVSDFGMSRRVLKTGGKGKQVGVVFSYRLSQAARVTITIERQARGVKVRRKGKVRCVKPRKGERKPRCARWLKVGVLRDAGKAGEQSLPFKGKLGGKPLRPGRYRATIVATDEAGQKSQPRRVGFRVVRD